MIIFLPQIAEYVKIAMQLNLTLIVDCGKKTTTL